MITQKFIRIVWKGLYKRKTNSKRDNQMTKKILKKANKIEKYRPDL